MRYNTPELKELQKELKKEYQREYNKRPDVIVKRIEYNQRPDVIERRNLLQKKRRHAADAVNGIYHRWHPITKPDRQC